MLDDHPPTDAIDGVLVVRPDGMPEGIDAVVISSDGHEHLREPAQLVAEFERVLAPGGTLVLSTPNDLGTTDHDEVSLTQDDLDELLADGFRISQRLGQIAGNDPIDGDLPPGILEQSSFDLRPDTLIVVAERT